MTSNTEDQPYWSGSGNMTKGWIQSPRQRGTMNIIWSCFLLIFTCTWSVMHLNIPAPSDTRLQITIRKIRWVLFIIYAPDALALLAACQWQSARISRRDMQQLGVTNWTTVHGFLADSGGFVLSAPDSPPFPVNSRAIYYLVSKGYLNPPSQTIKDIWDKSKTDRFAKFAAATQSLYLLCEVVARTIQKLETSCLETMTVSFLVCAIATSYFWLQKPMDVEVPFVLHMQIPLMRVLQDAGPVAEKPYQDTPMDFVEQPGWSVWNRRKPFRTFGGLTTRPIQRIPNDYILPPLTLRLSIATWIITVLYSTIHFARWNSEFPTLCELYLWRCSSATLWAILFTWGLVLVFSVKPGFDYTHTVLGIWVHETTKNKNWWRRHALDLPGALSSALYFVARTCLIVEIFWSLREMPSSVYQTVQWSQYLPHA